MPYSASLTGYQPSPRYGTSTPWTMARLEQGASRTGSFTTIEVQALGAYTDPAAPPRYDFTTELVTTYPGWVRVVFVDDNGTEEPTDPIFVGSAIRPTVAEVANLMPDRTTLAGGGEAGTFTASTRPTATQVDQLIDMVLDTVEPLVPADASAEAVRSARTVVSLQAAILIETGHFGEQVDVNDQRVTVWASLLERHTAILTAAAQDNQPGGVRAYGVPVSTVLSSSYSDPAGLLP